MFESLVLFALLLLTFFGGLVVPLLMGASLWIERRKHRSRMLRRRAGVSQGGQREIIADNEHALDSAPRRLHWSDLRGIWAVSAIACVVVMPLVAWVSPFGDDLVFAIHPILCVGWWLEMRRRGINHAEVCALAVWLLAYVAWSLSLLAPLQYASWVNGQLDGDEVGFVVAHALDIPWDQGRALWLLYVASGLGCVLVGIGMARMNRPLIAPLAAVAVWIPFVYAVWVLNPIMGLLGLVMSVGIAGYGISLAVRRNQDNAEISVPPETRKSRPAVPRKGMKRTVIGTATIVVMGVAATVWVRESGMFDRGTVIAATWLAMLVVPVASALLARMNVRLRLALKLAAGAWIVTVSLLALNHMLGPSSSLYSVLIRGIEPDQPGGDFDVFIHPQALAVWLVAIVAFAVAYRAGRLMSYGALLVGLLWFPIATFAVGLSFHTHQLGLLPDQFGIASMVAMGCVVLVIMWHFFGPASADDPSASVQPTEDGLDQSQ